MKTFSLNSPRLSVTCALALLGFGAAMALAQNGGVVPADVLAAESRRVEVVAKISESTIAVFGVGAVGGGGSAVVITPDGYALTNFHVTKPVGTHLKCGMNDGEFYDAVIVGVDPTGDVALIKLLGREDFPAAKLGNSDDVAAGDWCIVSGNPFLLATDFHPTVTYGIISGVHRYQYPSGTLLEYADCIQTDAAINPGNSGGPLWNTAGELIGINGRGSFEKRGRVNVGVGYAISINQIKNFMGYLRSGRIVDHATLGATVATDDEGRVLVTNILQSSDAYRRGLRYGDQVVAFGGRPITTTNAFKNALGIFPKGWRVPLSFVRDGQQTDVSVRLSGVHRSEELIAKLQLGGIAPPAPRPRGDKPKSPDDKRPEPAKPVSGKTPLAPQIAAVFEARSGYANYHFNRLERDRIWKAFSARCDFSKWAVPWQMTGEYEQAEMSVDLDERVAQGRLEGVFEVIDFERELADQRVPRSSGGLLLALHQWRRLLVHGPEAYGEVYYLGSMPLTRGADHVDVLVGTYDVLETRFYFERKSGLLVKLELFPDLGVDPCELLFHDYAERSGHLLPARVEVRYGEDVKSLSLLGLSFSAAETP